MFATQALKAGAPSAASQLKAQHGLELISIMRSAHESQPEKSAKVYVDHETAEYVVQFFIGSSHLEDSDYCTGNKDDAIGTATAFAVKVRATKNPACQ